MKVDKAVNNRVCDSDTLPSSSDTQQNIDVANSHATNDSDCKQRLADAIADVPFRRHELAVLRMYMDNRCD